MRGRWDAIISRCARGRRIYDIDPPVLDLLRMGCQQLLGLQTPPHAAIHETVTVARNFFGQGAGGFVNAVLRRVGERADEWEEVIRSSTASRTEFLSLWHSHPRWIVEKFEEALAASGRDRDDVESVLAADNEPAKVALVARDITVGQLAERVGAARMEAEPGTPVEGPDGLWLDMCAGPGGKAATLASLAADRGARVHANEPREHRLDLVADAVEPWSDIVDLRLGDGRDLGSQEPDRYDRILVDAPCTGLGALRRRPEARWRKDPGDVPPLARLQGELLASAFGALRPGGALVYSTCTPVVEETRSVVSSFVQATERARLLDAGSIASAVAVREVAGYDGCVQLWPDADETDGMFLAVLAKE